VRKIERERERGSGKVERERERGSEKDRKRDIKRNYKVVALKYN
jgi:hypothetical protein